MYFDITPGSSPSTPITIGKMTSSSPRSPGCDSLSEFLQSSSTSPSSTSRTSHCAYPSWPQGSSLGNPTGSFRSGAASSYISDEDLFFLDDVDGEAPLLHEAPAPPREIPIGQALPLMPLYASEKPKKSRRKSSVRHKPRRSSKPMTPISESPEAPAE